MKAFIRISTGERIRNINLTYATMWKFVRNFYLPELLAIGSEILLQPESSAVFATGTLNVKPICKEKSYPLSVKLVLNKYQNRGVFNSKWNIYIEFHLV